jgi:hypothetical protein
MQTDTNIWLSECDAILAQLLGESEQENPVAEGCGSGARPVTSAPRANGGDEASLKEVSLFYLFAELKITKWRKSVNYTSTLTGTTKDGVSVEE